MPLLDKEQRKLVKAFLSEVLTDGDLKQQFNRAQKRDKEKMKRVKAFVSEVLPEFNIEVIPDCETAMLHQYMGILQEISAERAGAHKGAVKPPRLPRRRR